MLLAAWKQVSQFIRSRKRPRVFVVLLALTLLAISSLLGPKLFWVYVWVNSRNLNATNIMDDRGGQVLEMMEKRGLGKEAGMFSRLRMNAQTLNPAGYTGSGKESGYIQLVLGVGKQPLVFYRLFHVRLGGHFYVTWEVGPNNKTPLSMALIEKWFREHESKLDAEINSVLTSASWGFGADPDKLKMATEIYFSAKKLLDEDDILAIYDVRTPGLVLRIEQSVDALNPPDFKSSKANWIQDDQVNRGH